MVISTGKSWCCKINLIYCKIHSKIICIHIFTCIAERYNNHYYHFLIFSYIVLILNLERNHTKFMVIMFIYCHVIQYLLCLIFIRVNNITLQSLIHIKKKSFSMLNIHVTDLYTKKNRFKPSFITIKS